MPLLTSNVRCKIMNGIKILIIAFSLLLPISSYAEVSYSDPALSDFLDSLINKNTFYPKTLDLLHSIEDANSLIVLTNYYIGSGGSEILGQLITQKGYEILTLLKNELKNPIACSREYDTACIGSISNKTTAIKKYINAIENGVVLCPDIGNCPAPNKSVK